MPDLITYLLYICMYDLLCVLLQRLGELSLRIQRLDISLNILEAKVRRQAMFLLNEYAIVLYCVHNIILLVKCAITANLFNAGPRYM